MRINKMITKRIIFDLLPNSLKLILQGNVWISVWRICMWILGLLKQTLSMAPSVSVLTGFDRKKNDLDLQFHHKTQTPTVSFQTQELTLSGRALKDDTE